jgi:hypothetical protein
VKSQIDTYLSRRLSRWVDVAREHARVVIGVCLLVTAASAVYAAMGLGINSDNVRLVATDLPSRQNHEAFAKLFPNLENALMVVVDAETPELARSSAESLAAAIVADRDRFSDAYMAGGGDFFETHALLYRSADDLDIFGDQMARLQPILGSLERDASVAGLAELVEQGLEQVALANGQGMGPDEWATILDSVGEATVAVYTEFPLALSWEQMLLQGSAVEVVKRRVIVVHPILDFGSILAARDAVARIRELAAGLQLSPERGVRVRITGNPALNYEEMFGIAWDIGGGGVICFFVVIGVLTRALRSLRLVIAAVATLLVGLVWTAAFATAAVGHLTLVSAAFGVLFIGLGVDFGIHLGMAYASCLQEGRPHDAALREAASRVGSSLVICTVTTSIGFYVFVPTDYLGVAELGLIAGSGMFIILFLTLTLFPALLSTWLRIDASHIARPLHFRTTWWRVFDSHPRAVLVTAVALGVAASPLLTRARFDENVIAMRDPSTESVQAFNDLLADSGTLSPWFINSVAPDLAQASERATRFGALDTVSQTLTLADYVPDDQDEKLEILYDIAYLLETPLTEPEPAPAKPIDEQVEALRGLHDFLSRPWVLEDQSALGRSMRLLRANLGDFLARVDDASEPTDALRKLDDLLLSNFADQMVRVRAALETDPIVLEELPDELRARMITPDGRARIQVFPKGDLSDRVQFARFVSQVQAVDPKAAGVAVNLVEFAQATRDSFRQALISAVVIIALLLLALWRRLAPMLLVMSPLALSSLLTVAVMALFDIPFNFGNVIVIPLLLGIGVDSGIHLAHRAEDLHGSSDDLMDSTTARAVFYSALTTTISFGTLAFSSHRGMASLGIVLSIGMVLTVVSNLIVLPSLIRLRAMRQQ